LSFSGWLHPDHQRWERKRWRNGKIWNILKARKRGEMLFNPLYWEGRVLHGKIMRKRRRLLKSINTMISDHPSNTLDMKIVIRMVIEDKILHLWKIVSRNNRRWIKSEAKKWKWMELFDTLPTRPKIMFF